MTPLTILPYPSGYITGRLASSLALHLLPEYPLSRRRTPRGRALTHEYWVITPLSFMHIRHTAVRIYVRFIFYPLAYPSNSSKILIPYVHGLMARENVSPCGGDLRLAIVHRGEEAWTSYFVCIFRILSYASFWVDVKIKIPFFIHSYFNIDHS